MASFYLATQQPHAAESHLKKVVELTKTPDAAFALADYYTARNDQGAALEVLLPLSKNAATSAAAAVRLAIADYQAGRHDEAYGRIGDVLNKDRDQLQALIAKTFFLMSDHHLETALETISLAVEKHKDSAAALYSLGRVQAARHQTDAAIAAYDSVLQLNPRATDARVALAQLHLSAGRAETSVGLAKQVVASEPQNLRARLAVVRGLLAQKQLTGAQAELQALVAKNPDSAPVHAQMGVLQTMKQDPVGARRSFERALELDPASREALNGLVSLDLQAKRTADARARVDQAVAANADDPTILMIAARTYVTTGDAKRGEELLRQVIQIDSSYFDAYSALGQLYVRQGRLDAALAEFEQLAQRDSKPSSRPHFRRHDPSGAGQDSRRTSEVRTGAASRPERSGRCKQPRVALCRIRAKPGSGDGARAARCRPNAGRSRSQRHDRLGPHEEQSAARRATLL